MKFEKSVAKGHLLGGNSPRSSNIYMPEMCTVCEKYIDDNTVVLRAEYNSANIIVCEECAYDIHCGYEANL